MTQDFSKATPWRKGGCGDQVVFGPQQQVITCYSTIHADVAVETLNSYAARIEELEIMVMDAYNTGFIEGMRECQTPRGGKPWCDSEFRAALERNRNE